MSRNQEVQKQLQGVISNVGGFIQGIPGAIQAYDASVKPMEVTPTQQKLIDRRNKYSAPKAKAQSRTKKASDTVPRGSFNISPEHSSQGADSRVRRIKQESDEFVKAQKADPDAEFHKLFGGSGRAPSDPNDTGAKGTQMTVNTGKPIPQMTYQQFMDDIGTAAGLNVKDRFEAENLPGTPGYGESFSLNSNRNVGPIADGTAYARNLQQADTQGVGPIADGAQYAANIATRGTAGVGPLADGDTYAALVDGRVTPKVTLNAQAQGAQADQKERDRQLTPGNVDVEKGKRYTQPRGTEGDERFSNFGEEGPDVSELTGGISERGRAFLDAPMGAGYNAVRRAHATQGGIRQGNDFFIRDSSQEGGLQKVSRDAYYGVVNEGQSLRDAVAANPLATTPSGSQNPVVVGGKDGAEVIDDENTLKAKGFAANAVKEVMDFTKRTGAKSEEEVKNLIQKGLGNLS